MEQFSLELNNNEQRPIVYLKEWHNINALIDTGASFPVWTASERILEILGGKVIKKEVSFNGFGGETKGNLYKIYDVSIGKLRFPEMAVISCSELNNVPFHFILSATVFKDLIYEIDDKTKKFTVTIPDDEYYIRRMQIKDSGGKLHILYGNMN